MTWECNDAKVAQSCLMDSSSCWEAGSENTDVLVFDELLVSVSRRCESRWVKEWISVEILWGVPADDEEDDECDGGWWNCDALRVTRLGVWGVGMGGTLGWKDVCDEEECDEAELDWDGVVFGWVVGWWWSRIRSI